MKQRLKLVISRRCRSRLSETNVVALEFPIQSSPADPKHFSGTPLIAMDLLKHPLNCLSFQFFQIGI